MSSRRGGRLPFLSLLISLRPGQWTTNLFVFAALGFAQRLNVAMLCCFYRRKRIRFTHKGI
jgi:hypothetical protein